MAATTKMNLFCDDMLGLPLRGLTRRFPGIHQTGIEI
jgi:hypothetical protein